MMACQHIEGRLPSKNDSTQEKKRQIRRMCELVGLKRIRIGRVMLGDLPAGQWRYLRGDEIF